MSVYNEERKWIEQAVISILEQSYSDLEFIIICDNPDIEDDIKEYLLLLERMNQNVIILWNEKNIGLAKSLNRGIEVAKGEYIARMDADDISDGERLRKELDFLIENNYDLVSTNKINIDEESKWISVDKDIVKNPNQVLLYGNIIIHSSVLVKRKILNVLGGYRELINSEDWDLWLRMVEGGYTIGILNEPLLMYRVRYNSASIGRQLQQFYVSQYIVKLHRERVRYGKDTFSVINMNRYLKNKKITNQKQRRFARAYNYIQFALKERENRRFIFCIINIIKAGYFFPPLVYRDLNSFVRILLKERC